MRETCARVLAAALMTGAIATAMGLPTVFESGGRPDLGIIFEPEIILPIIGLAALAILPVAYKKIRARQPT